MALRGRAFAVLALVGLLSLTAAPAALAAHHYPRSLTKVFVSTCTRTARAVTGDRVSTTTAHKYCTATLACLENRLTVGQFVATARKLETGARNPNAKVFARCEAQGRRKALH